MHAGIARFSGKDRGRQVQSCSWSNAIETQSLTGEQ
jgi:hypothetical protein